MPSINADFATQKRRKQHEEMLKDLTSGCSAETCWPTRNPLTCALCWLSNFNDAYHEHQRLLELTTVWPGEDYRREFILRFREAANAALCKAMMLGLTESVMTDRQKRWVRDHMKKD